MSAKEKQAAAKQTFVFLAPLTSKQSAKQTKEHRRCEFASYNLLSKKQAAAKQKSIADENQGTPQGGMQSERKE